MSAHPKIATNSHGTLSRSACLSPPSRIVIAIQYAAMFTENQTEAEDSGKMVTPSSHRTGRAGTRLMSVFQP